MRIPSVPSPTNGLRRPGQSLKTSKQVALGDGKTMETLVLALLKAPICQAPDWLGVKIIRMFSDPLGSDFAHPSVEVCTGTVSRGLAHTFVT